MNKNEGFTVVELLVAIVIMSFVMSGVFILFKSAVLNKTIGDNQHIATSQAETFFRESRRTLALADYDSLTVNSAAGSLLLCSYTYLEDLNAKNYKTAEQKQYDIKISWVNQSKKQLKLEKFLHETPTNAVFTLKFPQDGYDKLSAFDELNGKSPIELVGTFTKGVHEIDDKKMYFNSDVKSVKIDIPVKYRVEKLFKVRHYVDIVKVAEND